MAKGTKRKNRHKPEVTAENDVKDEASQAEELKDEIVADEQPSQENNAEPEPSDRRGRKKRVKVSKPESETEYFQEKRNLEDLWKQVFPVGTEWDQLDMVYKYNWNFSHLEEALEEGGELYDKKVYLFGCTEPQLLSFRDESKLTMIPVVVAVVSPFPPSDKIGIKSVQRVTEEIVPMKKMKMDWVPYIPLEQRESQVERLKKSQIFILSCTQRRAGLRQLKLDRIKTFEYCLPYFYHPFQEDEFEQSTVVDILFPIDPKPVIAEFDWEFDEFEVNMDYYPWGKPFDNLIKNFQEFTDKLIEEEHLSADQKQPFMDFVKEKVREAKKANRQAREARQKALAEMSEEAKAAFKNMRFYKFYPATSPDTPDVSSVKATFINRYYGHAHRVI